MESNEYLSFSSSLSNEELVALPKFKEYLADNNIFYTQIHYTNEILIRFLRARSFNFKEAYEMYMIYLKWAEQNNIREIESMNFPNNDKLRLFYPHGLHKVTRQGLPIFIQTLGDLKIDDINNLLPGKMLDLYIASICEGLIKRVFPSCSRAAKKHIGQVVSIVDLKRLTTSLMSRKVFDFISTQLNICEKYYPETLGGLYFVNSGFVFRAMWSVCKHFLSYKTQGKISFYGVDYQQKLLEKIPSENLPKFLGGECNCDPYGCIFSNAGPWMEATPLMNTMTYTPLSITMQKKQVYDSNKSEEDNTMFMKDHLTINKRINDNC